MQKSVIEDVFDHILRRQTAQGPERAFRFKGIKLMNGRVIPAHYPNNLGTPPPSLHMSKRTVWCNAIAVPEDEAVTNTKQQADADAEPEAASSRNPNAQSSTKKLAKGKGKQKQPGRRSTKNQASNSERLVSSQVRDTTQSDYVQVNQITMDILCHKASLIISPFWNIVRNSLWNIIFETKFL